MLWRRKRPLTDFDDEIRSHLSLEADELRGSSAPGIDCEAQARRAFGNTTSIKESFYERSRFGLWDQLLRDIRHALRLFCRRPAFSAVVILTLAVGIGAALAIFSIINAVLLRPLPYKDPSRLAMLWSEDSTHGLLEGRVSLLNFADWKQRNHAFEDMTIFIGQTFLLSNSDGARERMRSARVPANFFSVVGVNPSVGRLFSVDEERRGERVVVLSYRLWQRRFGGSEKAIGSDFVMDGRTSRIIGVMPASFQYPFPDTQVWEPITSHPYWAARDRSALRSDSNWYALARLTPGVSLSEAQAEMSVIARRLADEHPEDRIQPEIRVVPLDVQTSGRLRVPLAVLFAAVFLMLLIACLNVANLLLARGSARQREFSMRRALGASRGRIIQQLLTESLVLSVAGSLVGVGLAAAILAAIVAFGPKQMPRLQEAHIDSSSLLFTVGLTLFAALVSGLWPAFRSETAPARSREWITVSHSGVRNAIVMSEFAIALVLLAGAGLMVRSFALLENVDPGFQPDKLLIMRIDLHVGRTSAQQVAYFQDVINRVSAIPGVRSAGAISGFLQSDPEDAIEIKGRTPQQPGPSDDLIAGPLFQTVGISLKRGRYFSGQDRPDSEPVAIVNQKMARLYWPDEDPIGRQFRYPGHKPSPWVTVIGVVGDMRRQGIEREPIPQVFRPHAQESEDMLEVLVRTAGNPEPMAPVIRSEIQSLDKTVAKFDIATVEQQLNKQTEERGFQTSLISAFSVIALLLSAIGIYGLMHYFVAQRTQEIGVRMALGARKGNVLAMIVRQGLLLATIGIAVGTVLALAMSRLLSTLLYGVTPTDPVTFAAAPTLMIIVAILACWLPARRATHIDPMLALRQD